MPDVPCVGDESESEENLSLLLISMDVSLLTLDCRDIVPLALDCRDIVLLVIVEAMLSLTE